MSKFNINYTLLLAVYSGLTFLLRSQKLEKFDFNFKQIVYINILPFSFISLVTSFIATITYFISCIYNDIYININKNDNDMTYDMKKELIENTINIRDILFNTFLSCIIISVLTLIISSVLWNYKM